jgi:hypothetical protein
MRETRKSLLLKAHSVWSRGVPGFYYPYRYEGTGIYLNIKESRMML